MQKNYRHMWLHSTDMPMKVVRIPSYLMDAILSITAQVKFRLA